MSSGQDHPQPPGVAPRPLEDPSLDRFIEIMRRLDRHAALSVDPAMNYWEDFDFPHYYHPDHEPEPDEGIGSDDDLQQEEEDNRAAAK
ncbi:hypothetical protein QR680_009872 [Steinernema hermaphroditum]|nr:hypothetical protein QR680_009872 [Steinernema hermaphroditum]